MANNSSKQPKTELSPEVISLIRVSTAEQASEGRAGVPRQRTANIRAAEHHGVRIRREIVAVDVSGRHVEHDPDFQQLFRDLANDPLVRGVVVPEQSRIFRPENFSDYAILDHFARNKKLIYTPTAVIDPTTPEGRMSLVLNGMMSGEELHKIRTRCGGAKEELREQGKHVGGNHMLPRGIRFVRERDANDRVIGTHWEHIPEEVERIKRAYELLFASYSFEAIAVEIGGGWTAEGIRGSMLNPIWKGVRRSAYAATGPEVPIKGTTKFRRKLELRETPLDVKIDLPSIISDEAWAKAEAIILSRKAEWKKTKLKNEGRDRHLAIGVARCSCGESLHPKYGSNNRSHLDLYVCKTRYRRGVGCGMKSIKRVDLDATIESMVIDQLLDADFILGVFARILELDRAEDPTRGIREAKLAKLDGARSELLAMVREGDMTRAEFKVEVSKLDNERRVLEASLPAPAPKVDPRSMVEMITKAFAAFATMTTASKRAILSGAVKEITVEGRTIPSVTLNGGYLGNGANSPMHSTPQPEIRTVADIVVRFPVAIEIPDTYVDRRKQNGNAPASREALDRGRDTRYGRERAA